MPDDDIALVRKTLAGDKQAFEQLVRQTTPHVFGIIRRFFSERHSMEDIAQDVFVSAYQGLRTYSQDRPFKNWLAGIAVRQCYRALRARKQNQQILASEMGSDAAAAALDACCFGQGGPEAVSAESQAIVRHLVAQIMQLLSPKERMILVLTEVEGWSIREVADMLGLSQINAKVSAFRARRHAGQLFKALSQHKAVSGARLGEES